MAKIAYNKLPHNLLHAAYLMDAMVELELYDELKQVFHVEKKYQEEGVWYNFINIIIQMLIIHKIHY